MKRSALVAMLFLVLTGSLARAQFLASDIGYYVSTPGGTYFTINNPTESFLSIRTRTLSAGFAGLIPDTHTDLFRNPAIGAPGMKDEVFVDYGQSGNIGRVFAGTAIQAGGGALIGAVNLERLSGWSNGSRSSSSTSLVGSTSRNESKDETIYDSFGGHFGYVWTWGERNAFGATYAYQRRNTEQHDLTLWESIYPSSLSLSTDSRDDVGTGNKHRLQLGTSISTATGRFLLGLRGEFSSDKLNNGSLSVSRNTYWTQSQSSKVNDLSSAGFVLDGIYESRPDDRSVLRYVVSLGVTSFDIAATGMTTALDSFYLVNVLNTSVTEVGDGTVTDLLFGTGYQRQVAGGLTAYAGASLRYLRNSFEGSFTGRSTQAPPSSYPPPDESRSADNRYTVWDLRIPVAAEFLLGEYFTVRGGLEPRYLTHSSSQKTESTISSTQQTRTSSEYTYSYHRLTFNSQFGIAAHHAEYGEVNILFGREIGDTGYWAFFVRYFL
jgi:hypothetical protein